MEERQDAGRRQCHGARALPGGRAAVPALAHPQHLRRSEGTRRLQVLPAGRPPLEAGRGRSIAPACASYRPLVRRTRTHLEHPNSWSTTMHNTKLLWAFAMLCAGSASFAAPAQYLYQDHSSPALIDRDSAIAVWKDQVDDSMRVRLRKLYPVENW